MAEKITSRYSPRKRELTLALRGDLLSTNADSYAQRIDQLVADHADDAWHSVKFEMTTAKLVDSVGLNLLVGLVRSFQSKNIPVKVVIASPSVHRLFQRSKFDELVELAVKQPGGTKRASNA